MSLTFLHILIISATVFAVIGSGFYVSRSVRSSAGYSVAGRSAGASLVAGSIAGTVVGGGATVGTAQLAYSFGLSAWWFTLGSGIAFILMGIFYAKRLRNTALETIPQYLELYYGKKAEMLFFHYFFHRYPSVRCCQFTAGHRDHFRPFRADAFSVRPSPYGSRYRLYFFRRHEKRRRQRYPENGNYLDFSIHIRRHCFSAVTGKQYPLFISRFSF